MKYGVHFFFLNSVLTAALLAQTAAQAPSASSSISTKSVAEICGGEANYEQLLDIGRKPSLQQVTSFDGHPIELTIIALEYTDRQIDATKAYSPEFCALARTWVGVNISTDGDVDGFANSAGGVQGGRGKLLPKSLARIESLIDHLPMMGIEFHPPSGGCRLVCIAMAKMWRGCMTLQISPTGSSN